MKLTVLTINYNNKEGLIKTFESVRAQTWNEFEFIVIDGGSTDGGKALIEQNDQIDYWVSEKDSGVYNAMNKGIKKANGDYIIFMNSGDYFYNEFVLEKVKDQLDSNIDILYGDSVFFNQKGYKKVIKAPEKLTFGFFYDGELNHQAVFTKRSLFSDYMYYNEDYKICADWEFFIVTVCLHNFTFKHLKEVICYYDYSGFSAQVENLPIYIQERETTLRKYFPAFIDDAEITKEARAKRIKQVLYIKNYPGAWRIFKGIINLFLLFLPKSTKSSAKK